MVLFWTCGLDALTRYCKLINFLYLIIVSYTTLQINFGYALNLFHRELNSFDVFRFFAELFALCVYSIKHCIVHLLMTNLYIC